MIKVNYKNLKKALWVAVAISLLIGTVAGSIVTYALKSRPVNVENIINGTLDGIDVDDNVKISAGVGSLLDDTCINLNKTRIVEVESDATEPQVNATLIRCTGYNDIGYTRSGEWTRHGVVAGKYEWLGKSCNLYRQNEDGTIGELIGTYEFLDTGYGINGSLEKGTSIDVWHPTEEAVWDWMAEYGDYVYIEFV